LIRGLVVAGFGLATQDWAFIVLLALLGAAEGGVSPLMQSLLARVLLVAPREVPRRLIWPAYNCSAIAAQGDLGARWIEV
jgi:hypothetical protein